MEHRGEFFQVKGPLNIARSAQGQPVIFQAGASEDGKNFAARRADAIFVGHDSLEEAKAYYQDVKARAASFGRNPDDLLILPGIRPVVGQTPADAEAKYQELAHLVSIENALAMLGRPFNDYDFSQHDLDAPFPDVSEHGANSNQSASLKILRAAREEQLTLRQAALRFATPRSQFVGTPVQLADTFQRWLDERGADGFVTFESPARSVGAVRERGRADLASARHLPEGLHGRDVARQLGLARARQPLFAEKSRRVEGW